MRELDKVLEEDEKVLWEGKPVFWPFFLGRSLPLTIFGVFWMGFLSFFFLASLLAPGPFAFIIFLTPHFWIGITLLFGPIMYNALVYENSYYAITSKRVILQTGVIGRDFQTIDFDQITNAEVNVGIFDKLFSSSSGSIYLATAGGPALNLSYRQTNTILQSLVSRNTLSNIPNPYEVFKFFKKVSHAVKTDIQYPNKYRPKINPGYQTEFPTRKAMQEKEVRITPPQSRRTITPPVPLSYFTKLKLILTTPQQFFSQLKEDEIWPSVHFLSTTSFIFS